MKQEITIGRRLVMIKRILVALDPDADTPIATQYAIKLARDVDASLTGLAVVDVSNIYPTSIAGGTENTHYARGMWMELSEETRKVAGKLLEEFKRSVELSGVRYTAIKMEGASFDRIIDGMKYHDLLVAGRDSRFFYNEPTRDTKTLAKVVKDGISPTLVITGPYKEITNVLIAYDGSAPAARSLKSFVQLQPFGKNLNIELIHVLNKESEEAVSLARTTLELAENYLNAHGYHQIIKNVLYNSNPGDAIQAHGKGTDTDLIVLGAHSVSAIRRVTFGSTTHQLITQTETPLFLSS